MSSSLCKCWPAKGKAGKGLDTLIISGLSFKTTMPVFDFKCAKCKTLHKDVWRKRDEPAPQCDSCGGETEKVWLASAPVHDFHEGWYEHLAYEPMYFSSRKKLKDYTRQNGLVMDYVEGR